MTDNRPRPDFIKHYEEIQLPDNDHYDDSDELQTIRSPFARVFGLKQLGIHHVLLLPGRRTSYPHAESLEEEFVYVIEGNPDAWIDGHLHRLAPGDGVGFPAGTGICHTFINNTDRNVRLLVVGEASRPDNRVYYPRNLEQRARKDWWQEAPERPLGPHDGLPDRLRR